MSARMAIVSAAVILLGLAAVALAAHLGHRATPGPVVHTDNAFDFTVHAPRRVAFPLFGAWGERAWGGDSWKPRFLHPDPPRDEAGEVFLVEHGHGGHQAVWVNTAFDADAGKVQYVYVIPEVQAVLIDLGLEELDRGASTLVHVRYRRTALKSEANALVEKLGRQDAAAAGEWERAVNAAVRPNPDRPRSTASSSD